MGKNVIDLRGNTIVADKFEGEVEVEVELDASDVEVSAGDDGLAAGSVQEALQALATRIAALEPSGD